MEPQEEIPPSLSVDLANPLHKELYFLIAKFLSGGPCQRASQALIEELEANEIIPKSVNWLGETLNQDFKTFSSKFDHITPHHLPKLLDQLVKTINVKESSSSIPSRSLLSYSTFSFVQKGSDSPKKSGTFSWCKKYGQKLQIRPEKKLRASITPVQAIADRPISGCGVGHNLIKPDFYRRLGISCNTLGHLSAVYCVLFDISGKYIITGADDHLVKIWSAIDGRLLATLRGTPNEIADIAVNYENTLLAIGSCDKVIRVWCLRTCAPIAVLNGHCGNVTSIFFCPIPRSRSAVRYLASTSTDGSCAFWAYTDEPGEHIQFQQKPTLYQERMRPGHAQMICSSFSPGGIFMAAGSADNNVRVYHMVGADGPERILEVEEHADRVDSISWAHRGLRFASGSKDGTALIWRWEHGEWRYLRLNCGRVPGEVAVIYDDPKKRKRVTMVGWNTDDTLVLTAVSDFMIKVWDSYTGELIRVLRDHKDEAYVIESHPFNPRIICTAGHDGKLIIWDIGTSNVDDKGEKVMEYYNQLGDGQGHGAMFDCKWSPDGLMLAATDSHGHLMMLSVEADKNERFKKLPKELFFHTDYRPVTRDAITSEVVDEQTQVAPHLMPPPFLVDVDGNPYPPEQQRLVPGRENIHEDYLIPNVAMSAAGYQEVIEGIPVRSNIDEMIQQLAIEQGFDGRNRNRQSSGERRGVGLRRSGEVEGVRQSRGDWQTGHYGFPKRHIVPALTEGTLKSSEEIRVGNVELEESWYLEHRNTTSSQGSSSSASHPIGSAVESPAGRSRRIRRLALQAAERRQQENNQADFSQVEGVARPNPRPQQEISVDQEAPRRPIPGTPTRRRNAPTNRRPRPVRYNVGRILENQGVSDIENIMEVDEDSSSDVQVSMPSSDSSSSDSDSDWGGTLGNNSRVRDRRDAPTEVRKRSQRTRSSQSENEEADNKESDEEVEEEEEPKPGPSTKASTKEQNKITRPRKARAKTVDYSGGLDDIEEKYRPSEWLAEVIPKRSPYFPQLGDDLVYYRQGHEAYIKEIESKKLYEIPNKLKKMLLYVQQPDLEAEISVRVVNIKFELQPPRLVALKLARTNWETKEIILPVEHLYVKYHDVADVVDFLILRQMFDKSIPRRWNKGDRFRCLIQRNWWLGTIEDHEPYDSSFPDSNYLCYKVKWDNGDPERMSPWDMDIITDDFEIPEEFKNDGIPASDEDLRIGLYEATPMDWPPHGHQDAQCQKISNHLEQVMTLAISEPFLTPVDLNLFPDYAYEIEYPVDLSTIKSRLDSRFYRRVEFLKFDIKQIAINAERFNEMESDIVKNAKVIRDVCLHIIENPDSTNVNSVYHNIMKNFKKKEATEAKAVAKGNSKGSSKPSNSPKSGRNTASSSGSNRRTIRKSGKMRLRGKSSNTYHESESEDDRSWEQQCYELLTKIWQCKDATPFRQPVDIVTYHDYYSVIDTPMDLQTVREELRGGNYNSPLEFHKDMQMIFSNSKQYNTEKGSNIYTMTVRIQNMYTCLVKPILDGRRSRKQPNRGSPTKRSRQGPARACNSANSTPRKNPKRTAAVKNPYVKSEIRSDSSEDEAEAEYEENSPMLRTRAASKRSRSQLVPNGNSGVKMNGHSSSGTANSSSPRNNSSQPGPSRVRTIKKFRISSGESHKSNSPVRGKRKINGNLSPETSSSSKRHNNPIKEEEEDTDEFEDSEEASMPTLNVVSSRDIDADYSANESDFDEERNVRRSSRVRGRHGETHDTRFGGRSTRSYAEPQDATDEDDEGRYGKRRRITTRSSPIRSRNSNDSEARRPPMLTKKNGQVMSNVLSDSEAESEEENMDPNEPGPSSRLMRKAKLNGISQRSCRSRAKPVEETYDEEGEEDEDENEEDGTESSNDNDSDDNQDRRKQSPQKRATKKRHVSSGDDDEYSSSTRKTRGASSANTRRATRGSNRSAPTPNYVEDSGDSEPRITVSSRGRIRRTKSFVGE